jgi:hypothetical protein
MAATLEGEKLELAYGTYTERFKHLMAANFRDTFLNYYNPTETDSLMIALFGVHRFFEQQYQEMSSRFYQAYRKNETGLMAPVPYVAKTTPYASVITNMMVHGPVAIKRKEAALGVPYSEFSFVQKEQSVNHLVQEMVYKTLEAPRDNMMETMQQDPEVKRYIRKADSGACDFCHMLVSRGAVYLEKTSKFKAHGNCSCTGVAVFAKYRIPDESIEASNRWLEGRTKGAETKAGRAKINKDAVEAGLKKEVKETYIDKFGREATRTSYVDTEKGKLVKQAEKNNQMKKLDALKRKPGEDYHEPKMSDFQKQDLKSQTDKVLHEMNNIAL